jgi:hypothetical protein
VSNNNKGHYVTPDQLDRWCKSVGRTYASIEEEWRLNASVGLPNGSKLYRENGSVPPCWYVMGYACDDSDALADAKSIRESKEPIPALCPMCGAKLIREAKETP